MLVDRCYRVLHLISCLVVVPLQQLLGHGDIAAGVAVLVALVQSPVLNKQLVYVIIDALLMEMFPELAASADTSTPA